MVSLASKNYICYQPKGINADNKTNKVKCSAKGIQKAKNTGILTPESFESVVKDKITLQATNTGFRICSKTNGMKTYKQIKTGLTHYYDKRRVLEDGITTEPLDL